MWYTASSVQSNIVHTQIRYLVGTWWIIHSLWSFFLDDGNTWEIFFGARPIDGYSGAHLYTPPPPEEPILSGSFWIETVWWATLSGVSFISEWNNIWSLSWYAWNDQAGWIDFSQVTYHLSNTSFSWYAWNDGIWWIDMRGASFEYISEGAIGKVKIIGNLAWNNIYNTTYEIEWLVATINPTVLINEIRKNISMATRNISNNHKNTSIGWWFFNNGDSALLVDINNMLIFENLDNSSPTPIVEYSRNIRSRLVNLGNLDEPIYSVIIIGADIYIDDSIMPQEDGKPRVLIALKNEYWLWGNIYIDGRVPQLKSSLITEGSIFSAELIGSNVLYYNDNPSNLFAIPNRQLYVYGSLISYNTIWWYWLSNGIENRCPYNVMPCDNWTALKYDLNHFRDFQNDMPEAQKVTLRWYQPPGSTMTLDTYDEYSMIIEHDIRIFNNPPPWLMQP